MSYERDRDSMHHGVGAIAAVDAVTGARRYRTAMRNKAMRDKDKRRARVTMGPRGGLGATNLLASPGITTAPPVTPPPRKPLALSAMARPGVVLLTPAVQNAIIAMPPSATTSVAAPASAPAVPTSCPVGYMMTTQGCVLPPATVTTTPVPVAPTSSGVAGGGSPGGDAGPVVPVTTIEPNPELDDPSFAPAPSATSDASSLFTPTNIMIGVAALGAAYLLFGRKGA